jgi:FHS family L-fucose permease-like MFS transporter
LGENTKQGSSFLIMSIVGGAIAPVLMGLIGADNMAIGFIIPLVCFAVVLAYSRFHILANR